jgi:hypothetical protein
LKYPGNRLRVILFNNYMNVNFKSVFLFLFCVLLFIHSKAQNNSLKSDEIRTGFGYIYKDDSIQFIFGLQQQVIIGATKVDLEKRRKEIKQVNIAGDFNGWNPNDPKFQMKNMDGIIFKITISKADLGKRGDLRQFKYVLNHVYWVEPPLEAPNKSTGKDGNTNLTLRL